MSIRLTTLIALPFLLLFPGYGTAQEPTARITEYGRFETSDSVLIEAKDTSGSVRRESKKFTHLSTTKKIPCKVGETFGIRLEFANLPKGVNYTIRSEMHHPPIKQPDGTILKKSRGERTIKAGQMPGEHHTWSFLKGFEYELVPGNWTQVVFVDGVEVARITFQVQEPK